MDSTVGALIGLLVSIFLIIKKVSPAYSLILGALIGGLAGGFSLEEVVVSMTEGVKDVSSAVLRILTAGVLSGVLIKTGAAMTISNAIIRFWGEKRVYLALAFATMLLCAVGVFIDVAVITVAPVALSIGRSGDSYSATAACDDRWREKRKYYFAQSQHDYCGREFWGRFALGYVCQYYTGHNRFVVYRVRDSPFFPGETS